MNRLLATGKHCLILLLILKLAGGLWLGIADSAAAQERTSLAQRFFTEAPPAWTAQQEFYLTLDSSVTGKRRELGTDGKWTITHFKSYVKNRNGNMFDRWDTFESGAWKGLLRGDNSDYRFVLARNSDTKPWVIQSVTKTDQPSTKTWQLRKEFCVDLILGPRIYPLPRLVALKGFKCVSVNPETTKGEELMRVTFTHTPEGVNRVKQGWVVLDPSRYWVIRKCKIETDLGEKKEGKAIWTHELEYREGTNKHPILVKSVCKGKIWQKGQLIADPEFHASYDCQERPFIPDSEFTLSHYGLPEPHWLPAKKTPWFLWLGACGIGCLVLAMCVRFFKRRQMAG